jgi:CCR4-NOT transcription complex subunit 9
MPLSHKLRLYQLSTTVYCLLPIPYTIPHTPFYTLQAMYGHRPPTAPATPDNDLLAAWSNQYPQHPQAQAQQAQAMAMYERSRYGGQGGGGQGGGQGQGQYQPQQQQQQYINQNEHLMPPNLASQGQPLRGHTPQSQQPSTAGTMGAPLILNNLTQHLNNPPAPSVSHGGYHAPNQPQTSSKQLIAPNGQHPPAGSEEEKIFIMVTELLDPETREHSLLELSKKRETYEDLALVLWGGFGKSKPNKTPLC